MASLRAPATLKIWPNKDADVEARPLTAGEELAVVEDWGAVVLVRDGEGRIFQVARALLDL